MNIVSIYSLHLHLKNVNFFIVKVGRLGERSSGRSFYVHTLYIAFHYAVLVVYKLDLVAFGLFDRFITCTERVNRSFNSFLILLRSIKCEKDGKISNYE